MSNSTNHLRATTSLAVGAAMVALLTGCNGDSSENASSNDSISVMVMAPETGSGANFPDVHTVADAFAKQINEGGGINGRDLVVKFCDEKGDPNGAAKCARQAVNDKVAAVVGSVSFNAANYMPILEAAKIPYLAGTALSAQDFSSSVSYPVVSGPVGFAAAGADTVSQGCKNTKVVSLGIPVAQAGVTFFQMGVKSGGAPEAPVTEVSPTTTDYSATVASVKDSDCIFMVLPDPYTPQFLAAAKQQDLQARYFTPGGAISRTALTQAGGQLQNAQTVSNFVALEDPAWDQFKSAVDVQSLDSTNAIVQNAWVGMRIFSEVAQNVSAYDGATLIAALDKTTNLDTGGLTAPLNFSQELPIPQLNRIFNPNVVSLKVDGDQFVPVDDRGFVNAAQYLSPAG